MECALTITSVIETDAKGCDRRSDATAVMAEAELGPFSFFGVPEFFFGKLVGASEQQILYFNFAPGVIAAFRGTAYSFEAIEKSGAFKLVWSG